MGEYIAHCNEGINISKGQGETSYLRVKLLVLLEVVGGPETTQHSESAWHSLLEADGDTTSDTRTEQEYRGAESDLETPVLVAVEQIGSNTVESTNA